MAWEGIKAMIPPTLIRILVEKLVAMIVPAAGAVMVIIEGLKAAWGAIKRILAAFQKFFAFLKAVKDGNAGPKFAQALAAAAIAVIDFIANWLISKLAKGASKVGGKIKALAKKILGRKKGRAKSKKAKTRKSKKKPKPKKPAKKPPKAKKAQRKGKDKKADKKKDKERKKRERLAKAKRELPPKINRLLSKGVSQLRLKLQLRIWRARYRLSALTIEKSASEQINIIARVNPKVQLAKGYVYDKKKLLDMLNELANDYFNRNPDALGRARERGKELPAKEETKSKESLAPRTPEEHVAVAAEQRAATAPPKGERTLVEHGEVHGGAAVQSVQEVPRRPEHAVLHPGDRFNLGVKETGGASKGRSYDEIIADLNKAGLTSKQIGTAMHRLFRGLPAPSYVAGSEKALGELFGLLFGTEMQRDPRNMMFSMMLVDRMRNRGGTAPDISVTEAIKSHPAEMSEHLEGVRRLNKQLAEESDGETSKRKEAKSLSEIKRKQIALLRSWFQGELAAGRKPVTKDLAGLRTFLRKMIKRYFRKRKPNA
jgi:hypothetical protein